VGGTSWAPVLFLLGAACSAWRLQLGPTLCLALLLSFGLLRGDSNSDNINPNLVRNYFSCQPAFSPLLWIYLYSFVRSFIPSEWANKKPVCNLLSFVFSSHSQLFFFFFLFLFFSFLR